MELKNILQKTHQSSEKANQTVKHEQKSAIEKSSI